ncbi:WD repeat-containing protein 97, partial [Bufo gargarizans]|uniref:WD repeat-containing protein 97 n=1 Tax=Bufo gargarizans TaxID=30331 RepID=UPI001CF3FAB3
MSSFLQPPSEDTTRLQQQDLQQNLTQQAVTDLVLRDPGLGHVNDRAVSCPLLPQVEDFWAHLLFQASLDYIPVTVPCFLTSAVDLQKQSLPRSSVVSQEPEDADSLVWVPPPKVDMAISKLSKRTLVPSDDGSNLKDPLDRRAECTLRRNYSAASASASVAIACCEVSEFIRARTLRVQSGLDSGVARDDILDQFKTLLLGIDFLSDSSQQQSKLAAKSMALSSASRRPLWLKPWAADNTSRFNLCSLPYEPGRLFGSELDSLMENLADKKDLQELNLPVDMTLREKCKMLWARLRKEHRSLVIQMRRADLQPSVLVHGVQLLRRVTAPLPLLYVTHISEQRSLVSVDCAGTVRLHYEDGRLRGTRQLPWLVSGVLSACQVQLYVAWNPQELLLLDTSFGFLSRSPVQQGVSLCVYHPGRNLLFSAGCGGVIVWSLGHSRRSLVLQQSLSQGMTDEDRVSALTVDSTSPHVHTCYAACGTSVWEYDVSDGTLRSVRRHLHSRPISHLLFSEQLRLLISGSRDGSIKVWDDAAQLMAVYVGHTGPVTGLSLTSSGTVLVSGSEDASLRIWDLTTQEQMEEQRVSESLLGLDAFCSNGHYIVSYSSHELHVWQVHNLYQLHCHLGTSVTSITVSEDLTPSRALCVCADATVRLISSSTGQVIAALDGGERLLGAEYCALQGTVYVLLGDGHLLKATALTHPMHVASRVKVSSPHSLPCCFSLFSCAVDKEAAFTDSKAGSKQQPQEGSGEKEQLWNRKKLRFFCIIGYDDGNLRVYNGYSNLLQCEIEAHNPGQVTCLMSIPGNHTIVSAGSDLTVKVWRFFPYSEDSLSLCMSFYCAQQVGRLCSLNSQLFVAFHDSSSATYTLVQYCLKTGRRNDHPSGHDHQDQITGLCASSGLGLVASCGRDRTIRLWTEDNRLLRTLCLNASPESLSFGSGRGDLLVGIHGHIYRISLMTLLPHPYKLKVMCLESPPDASDPTIPAQCNLKSGGPEDMKRRTQPCSLVHRTAGDGFYDSVETTKENKTVQEAGGGCGRTGQGADAAAMSQECWILSSRDQELHLIQMGKLRSRKRTKNNKETSREAMEKYLQILYQEKPSYR